MGTDRTAWLSPEELALKLATREAVLAAGGQVFLSEQLGRTQSVISDWVSPNTRSFVPLDMARRIEALGAGSPGHPHITRAMARAQGDLLLDGAPSGEDFPLSRWLAEIAGESSDVIRMLASDASLPGSARQSLRTKTPAQRAELAREVDQLIDALAGLNQQLQGDT